MPHTQIDRNELIARRAHWDARAYDRLQKEDEDQVWDSYIEAKQLVQRLEGGPLTTEREQAELAAAKKARSARLREYKAFTARPR